MTPIGVMIDTACVRGALIELGIMATDGTIQLWIYEGYTIDETISGLLSWRFR
jgi:hypothetical protein